MRFICDRGICDRGIWKMGRLSGGRAFRCQLAPLRGAQCHSDGRDSWRCSLEFLCCASCASCAGWFGFCLRRGSSQGHLPVLTSNPRQSYQKWWACANPETGPVVVSSSPSIIHCSCICFLLSSSLHPSCRSCARDSRSKIPDPSADPFILPLSVPCTDALLSLSSPPSTEPQPCGVMPAPRNQ